MSAFGADQTFDYGWRLADKHSPHAKGVERGIAATQN
jgi:hypothetical protein